VAIQRTAGEFRPDRQNAARTVPTRPVRALRPSKTLFKMTMARPWEIYQENVELKVAPVKVSLR
jgi:hypothetical protein